MIAWFGWLSCAGGMFFLLVAAVGLLRLPDALSRQHAATKAGTVGVAFFAMGAALLARDPAWNLRFATIAALLLITLPIGAHALSRAAARSGQR